jgi:DNA repair exonuclease SbcCD ATPase subunit
MKIQKLEIKDFRGIKVIQLEPKDLTILGGKNRQGKTSFLKALKTALEGSTNPYDIRLGTDKATIFIGFDNGLDIKRTLTRKGQYLHVEREGFERKKPQDFLNSLGIGYFGLDPLSWFDSKTDKKNDLLKMINIELTPEMLTDAGLSPYDAETESKECTDPLATIDRLIETEMMVRRVCNKALKEDEIKLKALRDQIPEEMDFNNYDPDGLERLQNGLSEKRIRYSELQGQLKQKGDNERMRAEVQATINRFTKEREGLTPTSNSTIEQYRKEIEELTAKIQQLEVKLTEANEINRRINQLTEQIQLGEQQLSHIPEITISDEQFGEVKQGIEEFQGTIKAEKEKAKYYEIFKQLQPAEAALKAKEMESKRLTEIIENLRAIPGKLMAEAKLPIEGLSFENDKILVQGKDIDLLSGEERVKIVWGVIKQQNSEYKFINIDNWEMLDKEHKEWFLKEAKGDGYQYFIATVADEPQEGMTYLEKGEVKSG